MSRSGLADSPFFSPPPSMTTNAVASPIIEIGENKPTKVENVHDPMKPRHHDTTVSSNRDTTVARIHDTTIETVRKAVRELGKEAATHRFTPEEKKAILDIVYSYKSAGIKTSENEVARIAINFIIEDYRTSGKVSILDRVLKALNQ